MMIKILFCIFSINVLCQRYVLASDEEIALASAILENYDARFRPVRNFSDGLNVTLDIALNRIVVLDLKGAALTAQYWQRLMWTDQYLTWDPEQYGGLDHMLLPISNIWLPDIVCINGFEGLDVDKEASIIPATVKHDGSIIWAIPMPLVTSCEVAIRHFPYDSQVCWILFSSWAHSASDLYLGNDRGEMDIANYRMNGEWVLGETTASSYVAHTDQFEYTVVSYPIHLQRRALFYELNLIIPTFLVSLLATLVFLLPPESGEKIGLAITVFLALCVNMLVVSEQIPATSLETPIISTYYLISIIMVAISLVLTVLILNFHNPQVNARPPPQRVRVFVQRYLAPLVFLGRSSESKDDEGEMEILEKNKEKDDDWPILMKLDAIIAQISSGPTDRVQEEWQLMTRVLDRIFAVIFFIVTMVTTAVILLER